MSSYLWHRSSVFLAAVGGRLSVDRRCREWRRRRRLKVARRASTAEVHQGERVGQLVVHEGRGEQVELVLRTKSEHKLSAVSQLMLAGYIITW